MLDLLVLVTSLPCATPQWIPQGERKGVRLETREVPGSSFEEVRATTRSDAVPERLCDAVWGKDRRVLEAGFKKQQVLLETETERWTYEQVATPVVSDRDYTLHVKRESRDGGGCVITFDTQNHKGPPPQRGFVRIPVIRGSWEIAPTANGGATIVYSVYSEPGGSIPAFLAKGPSRDRAVEWLHVILARAATHEASR